ncbi:MAG TPA: hypothetical protein VK772_03820 [Puia sp.]|jgi:hypothetical protein|nr:hypothetical protein [Puia sp.]
MKYRILLLLLFTSYLVDAQDIIIKNDKSEIKAKITELTDLTIKYKKWEFLDGPVYNIDRANVFMIIYANGQREIINHSESSPVVVPVVPVGAENKATHANVTPPLSTTHHGIDTTINYQNIKVKYKPTRIFYSMETPGGLGLESETRVVKNVVNIGLMALYNFNTDYIKSDEIVAGYFSVYAPINRLTGNFKNQDGGLFVFAHIGGFWENYIVPTFDQNGLYTEPSYNVFGCYVAFGADYIFTKSFGVTFQTFETVQTGAKNQYTAGIVFSF